MDLKNEELSEEVFGNNMRDISELMSTLPEEPSDERMQSILQRVKGDVLMKDSADFAVNGIGKGIEGVFDAVVCLGKRDAKPKRSY